MKQYFIAPTASIKEALKQMDRAASKTLFVVINENLLLGAVSDGDIRRAVLRGDELSKNIKTIMNADPTYVKQGYHLDAVKKIMLEKEFALIPVLNDNREVVEILFWNKVFENSHQIAVKQLDVPVVIMAGGRGTRMEPFTRILPKPLIPIGEKPIIQLIMEEYTKFGMNRFFISVNHKAKMIKAYFEDSIAHNNISFINEDKPLGTAGALKFLEDKVDRTFFLSNCDIIIYDDYSKIYDFHKDGSYAITLVASMQHYEIPYGVCEIENGGSLKNILEKPEFDFLANTGMYVIEPSTLQWIQKNEFFNMTDFIQKLKEEDQKIGVYPVSEKSWIDVGQWEKYHAALKGFKDLL